MQTKNRPTTLRKLVACEPNTDVLTPKLIEDGASGLWVIQVGKERLTPECAIEWATRIIDLARNCNVAKVSIARSLFDTTTSSKYQTIEIDKQTLADFQKLQGEDSNDIRKVILSLIVFYADPLHELNIIFHKDALDGRTSYTKYTAQLAQFLKMNQTNYPTVKVEFDTDRLGIFCRLSPISTSKKFLGTILSALNEHKAFSLDIIDVPPAYQRNHALVKFLVKKARPDLEVDVEWTPTNIKFFTK